MVYAAGVPHDGQLASEFSDTSPKAWARYMERVRATAPKDRLARAFALSRQVRELTMADVRKQHPTADELTLKVAFVRRVYGDVLADKFERQLRSK